MPPLPRHLTPSAPEGREGALARMAEIALQRWPAILAAGLLALVLSAGVLWYGGTLSSGITKGIESDFARRLIEREIGYPGESSFLMLFHSDQLEVGDPRFLDALGTALAPLRADPRVRAVLAPDTAPPPVAERLRTRHSALAIATLRDEFPAAIAAYPELRDAVRSDELEIGFTGNLAFRHELDEVLERDLLIAEMISIPLSLLVLLFVFRTAAAAAVSVAVGGVAVVVGIAVVTALSHVADIAVYAVNVASLIGLGVAIDYSLFIVTRHRDELGAGASCADALRTAMRTAGRAVVFSGLAVAIGLGGLLFFRGSFLVSMGIAAAVVVALAVLCALTLLPALLVALGPRIDFGRLPLPRVVRGGLWRRLATWVMRRPLAVLIPTVALMLALGAPFLRLTMAAADVRALPRGIAARDVYEQLQREFPDQTGTRVFVVTQFPTAPAVTPERVGALYDLGRRMLQFPGATKFEGIVNSDARLSREFFEAEAELDEEMMPRAAREMRALVSRNNLALLILSVDAPPSSAPARAIVHALRADPRVADGRLLVTGPTAHGLDVTEFVFARAPAAMAFTAIATVAVLFGLLRSAILPLKAVLMNALSVTASFGALVWIFQEGHLANVLHFEAAPLDPTVPVLLFCVVFGLSMDYEVLMLARMREEYLRTGDNTWAVAEGLERSGRLVTSAAAIMITVFGAFALSRVVVVKALGVALALAVALDATLVRVLIVPATMRLLGHLNWWAPAALGGAARPPRGAADAPRSPGGGG
ncbi:MAG: MMPL family transporter [Candidatus Binatia bacterium]